MSVSGYMQNPALVEMVEVNTFCGLEKQNERLPLFEDILEGCGGFLC